jgi:Xylose isomerase-like TIM barrel
MKLACASGALHREIHSGELTQLEFLDLCARELACDGVVLDVRHFPRSDDDYLAHIKKMATDWGLSIAALSDSSFFASTPERMSEILDRAVVLGAPLIASPLAREIECSWSEQYGRLAQATTLAKRSNVTLALRNAAGTFAASTHDCKRVIKEADSAWLRFGPDPLEFDAASDPHALASNTVLLWSAPSRQWEEAVASVALAFASFRGFVALDDPSGAATIETLSEGVARWRDALCRSNKELNRR